MRSFTHKSKAIQQTKSTKSAKPSRALFRQSHDVYSILHLQRTIGNQAVQRLLQSKTEDLEASSASNASTGFAHDLHANGRNKIQPQLNVDTPEDKYEQEAERVADQVMRENRLNPKEVYAGNSAGKSASGVTVQMDSKPKGGGGSSSIGKEITVRGGEEDEEPPVQTSQSGSGPGREISLSNYLDRSSGGGKGLDGATNARMSSAFGYDFSKVKIHNNASAHSVSRSIGANAFTTGNNIYFSRGKYGPGTADGDRLLSHELTHVVQQSVVIVRSATANGLTMSTPDDAYEQQADTVADMVTTALHRSPSSVSSGSDVSRDERSPLAEAILQRKGSGVSELQRDGGLTVSIIGVLVSAGTWAVGQNGSHPMTVDPRLKRIAEVNKDRERYRSANPFRHQNWSFFDSTWEGATPISLDRRWMVDLRWQFNGAELTDVHLVQGWESFFPSDSTHAKLVMVDNQASNKRIGFRCEFEWDPASFGHGLYQCEGWISTDGSGSRTAWTWHNF